MEQKKIKGPIQWIANEPKEFPAGSGDYNLNLKLDNEFYNIYRDKTELEDLLKFMKKGAVIEVTAEGNKITHANLIQPAPEVQHNNEHFGNDLTNFEQLLDAAHHNFKDGFTIQTEMVSVDMEKKTALFKASVVVDRLESGRKQLFQAYGDCTQENVSSPLIGKHWIRMAETRAIARALRWATNTAKTAVEETEGPSEPETKLENKPKK